MNFRWLVDRCLTGMDGVFPRGCEDRVVNIPPKQVAPVSLGPATTSIPCHQGPEQDCRWITQSGMQIPFPGSGAHGGATKKWSKQAHEHRGSHAVRRRDCPVTGSQRERGPSGKPPWRIVILLQRQDLTGTERRPQRGRMGQETGQERG